jgi:hypothetical protein
MEYIGYLVVGFFGLIFIFDLATLYWINISQTPAEILITALAKTKNFHLTAPKGGI